MAKREADTRERILQAAKEEFLEKGYKDAWLRDITKKASVTTGALYGYFRNKEDLYGALVDEPYHRMLEMYDEILAQFHTLPPQEQMEQMRSYTGRGLQMMADYIYDNWDSFRLILCHSEGTPYGHLVEEMAARDIQATDDFSQTSQDAGISLNPVNPTLSCTLLYSMFFTFFAMVRQNLPREQSEQYITQLLDFYTGGWEKLWGC